MWLLRVSVASGLQQPDNLLKDLTGVQHYGDLNCFLYSFVRALRESWQIAELPLEDQVSQLTTLDLMNFILPLHLTPTSSLLSLLHSGFNLPAASPWMYCICSPEDITAAGGCSSVVSFFNRGLHTNAFQTYEMFLVLFCFVFFLVEDLEDMAT